MEAINVAAATAKPQPDAASILGWLPAKASLSMKTRLFSKNILRSGDVYAGVTSTSTSTLAFFLLLTGSLYLIYSYLKPPSTNGKPLWAISTMLADDTNISALDTELDSDEYEDEEASRSSGFLASSKERLALRKMLGRDTKRSSVVRIISSDPTSLLCERPMQVDLEPTGKRSFWPQLESSPVLPSGTLQRSASASPGPARKRKESGRLHTASPSRSPLGAGVARSRSADARSPLARTAARNKRNSSSSIGSTDSPSTGSPRLPQSSLNQEWAHTDPALLDIPPENDSGTPSINSLSSSVSAAIGHSALLAAASPTSSAVPSPTSSTFSISRAPSILKRRPQTFRTASLRDIDISFSLVSRKESLPVFANPAMHQVMLQAGAGAAPPPYQPTSPETAWSRSVRLVEPDWTPHVDSHVRARERFETESRFAAYADHGGFWFERFTQSTAAAGRDWDWRKRRARAQRAAALGVALGQSGLQAGNVGLTDVQLQSGETTTAVKAASRKVAAPPLITFTEQELKSAPLLKVDTESGRRSLSRENSETLSPQEEGGTPMSPTPSGTGTPLGGIFGANPSVDSINVVAAARVAQRRRASEDAGVQKRSMVNKMRRRLSASAGAGVPSSPGASPSGTPSAEVAFGHSPSPLAESYAFDSSSYSDLGGNGESKMASSFSVPGRLSSLSPKKVGLTNLRAGLRKDSGSEFLPDGSGGMELIPNSPDLNGAEQIEYVESVDGPRSSADAYSSLERQERSQVAPPRSAVKRNSAPTHTDELEELRHDDAEKDSISRVSRDSSSSDSLRRNMRSFDGYTARKEGLASLSTGVVSSPPTAKSRARNGSRSSIMRSASGAGSDLKRRSSRHSASETSSVGSSVGTGSGRYGRVRTDSVGSGPDPKMQPEPAPRGMVKRARSASIGSAGSGGSARGSGLSMTSSQTAG